MQYKFMTIDPNGGGTDNPEFPWIDTDIFVDANQLITILAWGQVHLYPPEYEGKMPWIGPEGCQNNNDCELSGNNLLLPFQPGAGLIAKIGSSGTPIYAGNFWNYFAGDNGGPLFLTINDYPDWYWDNRGLFYVLILIDAPPESIGGTCEETIRYIEQYTKNPINLRTGAKVMEFQDFKIQTPADTMTFTRRFNQTKLADSHYQYMGLGWSHNHSYQLSFTGTAPNQVAEIYMPSGAILRLDQDGTDHFEARSESSAVLDLVNGEYILTAQNKTTFVFADTTPYLLQRRTWPNGEVWEYEFDSNDNLETVKDGYGRELRFSYHTGHTGVDTFKNGQLWRVGDHTATGLDTPASAAGRFIQLDYVSEKVDGQVVTTPKALLSSVTDVRDDNLIWTYDYYGQASGETTTQLYNFLTERHSPDVDTNGDGISDGSLSLEALSYVIDSFGMLTQVMQSRGEGLLETELTFRPQYKYMTTETIAGKTTNHYFANRVYLGTGDPGSRFNWEVLDENYRVAGAGNTLGPQADLSWSADGKNLEKITDTLDQETTFHYVDDQLDYSLDDQGHRTEYTYDTVFTHLPAVIKVYDTDGLTVVRHQEFTYTAEGRLFEEKLIDPVTGTVVLQQTTRTYHNTGNGNGFLHTVTQEDSQGTNDITTTYSYDPAGRVNKTQRSSNFGNCDISFTVYDPVGNVVASICNYDRGTDPDPTTAAEAVALYDPQIPGKNKVTTHEYDALGRRVKTTLNAGSSFAQTSLTLYDALDRVWRTITHYQPMDSGLNSYAAPGVWQWDATHQVWRDGAGGSALTIEHGLDQTRNHIADTFYNERGLVRMQRDVLGNVTLYGYNDAGQLIRTVQSASDPDYDNTYGVAGDPELSVYVSSSAADQDIITLNEYDSVGNLVKTTDPLGQVSFTVYDALNRPVKTVRNAHENATVSLNPENVGYDAAHDPRTASYAISADPDRDQMTTTRYDSLGRVVRTQQLLGKRDSIENWTTTLYGYDALGRQIKSIRSASQPNYDIEADPDLSAYVPSSAADLDIVSTTVYENQGRVLYSEDVLGNRTWTAYDGLGRPIKTIINAVGTATDNGTSDPRSSSYVPSSEVDKDLISHTVYDDDGRVLETVDRLGRVTRQVYDDLGRQVRTVSNYVDNSYNDPADWVWESGQWKDAPSGTVISHGTDHDQNIISTTEYDDHGRAWKTFDQRYNESRMVYDTLGRRIMSITNYVAQGSEPENWVWDASDSRWEDGAGNGIDHGSANDLNQISTTIYNIAGQVIATVDARGTQTTFTYDAAGRRLSIIQAAGTSLASQSYTCYDKAGRVRRSIQNYRPLVDAEDEPILPDTYAAGVWAFNPTQHGPYQDQNLITEFIYDAASRQVQVIDPVGNTTATSYTKDSQVDTVTDAEGVETLYRYDQLRRRTRVVQSFVAQGSNDPAAWVWKDTATPEPRWEDGNNNALNHGADQDQNIIVDVTYDKAGRMLSLRNPLGHVTTYSYDALNRRLTLTNPLDQTWASDYVDLPTGGTQVKQTYPGLSSGSYIVERDFDRLGRLSSIDYDSPTTTPSVRFSYDAAGNRQTMTEYGGTGFTTPIRETVYGYDAVHRLTSVGFDTDGDSIVEETVSYAYDAGGLRTRLTLPGNLDITYVYDAKGQLVSLTDWDNQQTQMTYDQVGRHIATRRANGLRSRYSYDAASRLRKLRHSTNQRTLGHFEYQVDKRGNRTQALEVLPHPATTGDTLLAFDDTSLIYSGSWSDSSPFKVTDSPSSSLKTLFYGSQIEFTFGTGPDHGLFDVYIGKTLYQSYDGYAATPGERTKSVSLTGEGPFLFEIRNRPEHNSNSSGYRLRFKQVLIPDVAYDPHIIDYIYDALSRLQQADYNSGERVYDFDYDLAGNRLAELLSGSAVTPTNRYFAYNEINQLTVEGDTMAAGQVVADYTYTYDVNGNLLTKQDTTPTTLETYTWDRANRLLTAPGSTSYKYDGLGNRIQQTVSSVVTDYLLDTQPGLAVVLQQTTNNNTERFIHGLRGIHAHQDTSNHWFYPLQDGLGSVRGVADSVLAMQGTQHYEPYGSPFGAQGSLGMPFGFTGEMEDDNNLVYVRSRYYSHNTGPFLSQDTMEGNTHDPMSLNRYAYAYGNPVNRVDPSGHSPVPVESFLNSAMQPNPLQFATMMNAGMCEVSQQNPCTPGTSGCFSPAPTAPSDPRIVPTPSPAPRTETPSSSGGAPSPEGTVYGNEPYEVWQYRVDMQRRYRKLVFSQVAPIFGDIGAGTGAISFVAFVISIPLSGGVTAAIAATVSTVSGVIAVGSSSLSALSYAAAGNPGDAAAQFVGIAAGPAFGLSVNGLTSLMMGGFRRIPLVGRYFQETTNLYQEFPELMNVVEGLASNVYNGISYISDIPPGECPPWLLPRSLCETVVE